MDKNKVLMCGGAACVVASGIRLALAGVAESAVIGVIGAVFALVAVVAILFK